MFYLAIADGQIQKILEKEVIIMERTQSKSAEGAITKQELLEQIKTGSFTAKELCELFDRTPIDEVRLAILGRFKNTYLGHDFEDWLVIRIDQFAKESEWNIFAGLLRCAHHEVRDVRFNKGVMDQLITVLDSNFCDIVRRNDIPYFGNIPVKEYNDLLVILCGAMMHNSSFYGDRVKSFFRKVLKQEDWFSKDELMGSIKRILRVIGRFGDKSFLPLLREKGCNPVVMATFFAYSDSYQQKIELEGLRLTVIRYLEYLEQKK